MSKGKSAIDDHRITVTSSRQREYDWHCGCGTRGGGYDDSVSATAAGYEHVRKALIRSGS